MWYYVEKWGGGQMLCNRIKQFREYNNINPEQIAEIIGVSTNTYEEFESGKAVPTIDIIEKLAKSYKVTIDEFYGYTPRLTLHDKNFDFSTDVPEQTLKMSDLSWDEIQLILHYRQLEDKESLIKNVLQQNNNENK